MSGPLDPDRIADLQWQLHDLPSSEAAATGSAVRSGHSWPRRLRPRLDCGMATHLGVDAPDGVAGSWSPFTPSRFRFRFAAHGGRRRQVERPGQNDGVEVHTMVNHRRKKGSIVLRGCPATPRPQLPASRFTNPADAASGNVSVVGDFNDWTPGTHVLRRRSNGTLSAAVPVRPGSTLRFRYLGENGHWFDEPDADYIDSHGSVVEVRA